MEIKSISATSYSTYSTCPYSFKLKYFYKLLVPEIEAFKIGKALHTALELHHKNIEKEIIIQKIKETFLTEPIDNKKINNFSLVKKMFELYLKYPLGGTTKSLEYQFRISLPNINAVLHGYMDRITEEGEIIDYKTSAKDYSTADANTIQAEIYSYALKEIMKKEGKVIFYVLNKNKIKKSDYIPQIITLQPDTSKLLDKLSVFYKNVYNNKFEPKRGTHCLWCIYKDSCRFNKVKKK